MKQLCINYFSDFGILLTGDKTAANEEQSSLRPAKKDPFPNYAIVIVVVFAVVIVAILMVLIAIRQYRIKREIKRVLQATELRLIEEKQGSKTQYIA